MLVFGREGSRSPRRSTRCPDERLLLAVDQLEELFTACRSEAERAAFADTLARAAADPEGRAVVVVALRADFYGRFAAYPGLAELLGANQVLVGPMQALGAAARVELPAGRVGLRVEPELSDALVDDVEGEPGALPLLSTALLELWQKRQDNTLTLAAYRESGGVHGAVARLAEGTYARIPDDASRSCARSCCAWSARARATRPCAAALRSPSSTWSATRTWPTSSRRWPTAASSPSAKDRSRSPTRRCCASGHACASGSRRTPRGAGFAATSPRRRPSGTRPGAIRASSTAAPASPPPSTGAPTTPSSSTSSSASSSPRAARPPSRRRSAPRRTNRRLRALLAGVAVLLAAAVAGGIFAVVQRGEARDAETAQLAQRLGAQALVEEDLDLSLLLARQAVAIDDSPQTRGYLLAASCARPRDRDHARRRRALSDRRQSRREDARGRRRRRPGCSSSTPDVRADRRAAQVDRPRAGLDGLAYSPTARRSRSAARPAATSA